MYSRGAESHSGTCSIHSHIAAAYEHDLLAGEVPGVPVSHLLKEVRGRYHIFCIGILHGHTVTQLGSDPDKNGIGLFSQL